MSDTKRQEIAVIGSAAGHGKAIALSLARSDTHLFLFDRDQGISEVARMIRAQGANAESFVLDVCDTEGMPARFHEAFKAGTLDGLVYLPRAREEKDFLKTDSSSWDRDLDVGLKGAFFCARAAIPYLKARREGSPFVLFVSSVLSHLVGGESVGYHVAKAGLEQLVRYLAVRLGPFGIRVNAIRVGAALKGGREKQQDAKSSADDIRELQAVHPLGEVGCSDDISEAIQFLASRNSAFVTGHVLCLDGGLTLHEPIHLIRTLRDRQGQVL